jgi:7-cyano-7-deazaguanine synthase
MKPAVVLLSGGLDSATVLAQVVDAGFGAHALSMRYGQRHSVELKAAAAVAAALGAVRHEVVDVDLSRFGGSALTADIDVPKHDSVDDLPEGVPVTYVPARNTVFLSFALAWSEVLGAQDIFIGVNAVDYSGYPDCRPEFIEAFQNLANLAIASSTEEGRSVTIHAPLIEMSKAEIIRLGTRLGVDYSLTTSCYDPDDVGRACGACDSCLLRAQGFVDAGMSDPTFYSERGWRS